MRSPKTIKELNEACEKNMKIIWNDPEPIKGNDYTITYYDYVDKFSPILILYNGSSSEAEVYLHELMIID